VPPSSVTSIGSRERSARAAAPTERAEPKRTVLVTHPACNHHDTGLGHPESQERLPALLAAVREDVELGEVLLEQLGKKATEEDLLRVHTPKHVARVREAAEQARRRNSLVWLDADTAVSPGSWEAALAAAGCAIAAAETVLDGPASTAFALTRPPGHHASASREMGFCLFNNLAVAIRRMQAHERVGKVLVVDWDVHHGNGTQDIFYEDPSVFFLSLHLSPHYPGTGAAVERGAGAGRGTTRNVPLPHGTTPAEYRGRYLGVLDSVLSSFGPDLVVVSAGFDCLAGDPLGGFHFEPPDLHLLTKDLLERVAVPAQGRVVAALEGGYVPERIGSGLVNVLRAFAGLPPRGEDRGAA
jgi:acetoin utilization deacetylase AcuC-like enzyme